MPGSTRGPRLYFMVHSILFASNLSKTAKLHIIVVRGCCSPASSWSGGANTRTPVWQSCWYVKTTSLEGPPSITFMQFWLLSPPAPILCNLCQLMLEIKPPLLSGLFCLTHIHTASSPQKKICSGFVFVCWLKVRPVLCILRLDKIPLTQNRKIKCEKSMAVNHICKIMSNIF